VRLEGLSILKNSNNLIRIITRDLPACDIAQEENLQVKFVADRIPYLQLINNYSDISGTAFSYYGKCSRPMYDSHQSVKSGENSVCNTCTSVIVRSHFMPLLLSYMPSFCGFRAYLWQVSVYPSASQLPTHRQTRNAIPSARCT
jgi:hypothetical protein